MRVWVWCLPIALVGCDLIHDDEPRPAGTVMLLFRVEADSLPEEGWLFWHVEDRVLRYVAGEGFGPMGVTADCGSHAGIATIIQEDHADPDEITLVIETVPDDEEDPMVAQQTFSGPGEHQLIVHVACRR